MNIKTIVERKIINRGPVGTYDGAPMKISIGIIMLAINIFLTILFIYTLEPSVLVLLIMGIIAAIADPEPNYAIAWLLNNERP